MAQIIGILDAYAYRPMVWDIFVERVRKPPQGEASDEAKIAAALAASDHCLTVLESLMGEADWLAGGSAAPTLADFHAAPMLVYLAAAPEGAALLGRHGAMQAWLGRMKARLAMQATPSPLID
jgi:glutathione S-transferase